VLFKGIPVYYNLKVFCLDADGTHARFVRELAPESEDTSEWETIFTTGRGSPDAVFIIRIRAMWGTRG